MKEKVSMRLNRENTTVSGPLRYTLGCLITANLLFSGCASIRPDAVGDMSQSLTNKTEKDAARRMSAYSGALHGFIVGSLYSKSGEHEKAIEYFNKTNALMGEDVSPTVLLQLGEVLLAAGNGQEALKFIERAHLFHKDDFDVTLLYADLLHAQGEVSQAFGLLGEIPVTSPQGLEAALLRCAIVANQGDIHKGIVELVSYTSRNQSDDDGFYFLSIYQEIAGLLDDSEKSLKRAIKIDPVNISARMAYGRLLLKAGRAQEALQEYRAVQKQVPENLQIGSVVAAIEEGQGDIARLQGLLNGSELVLPSTVSIRYALAEFLLEKGRVGRALQELYVALLEDPNFHKARYRVALIFSSLGAIRDAVREVEWIPESSELYVKSRVFASVLDRQIKQHEDAEFHIKQALVKEKDNLQILVYLVAILRDSGQYGEAETVITKALETNPESASLIYDYAMLLHVMKREQEARKLMERLIQVDRENHAAMNYLAYSYTVPPVDKQKLPLALKMVTTALELDPSNGYYLDTKGWILYNLGKYSDAVQALSMAGQLVKQDGLVFEHLGDSLLKVKEQQRAYDVYRSALSAYESQRDMGTLLDHEAISRVKVKLRGLGFGVLDKG
jgi:tetratricopeptide (TPR) repeat protein